MSLATDLALERNAAVREAELLRAQVAELEAGRADLISTIETMNEENAQLAHRLWCLENPE